jgi:hypothetical protein
MLTARHFAQAARYTETGHKGLGNDSSDAISRSLLRTRHIRFRRIRCRVGLADRRGGLDVEPGVALPNVGGKEPVALERFARFRLLNTWDDPQHAVSTICLH